MDCRTWTCRFCAYVGLADGSDGFFYCLGCHSQAEDVINTAVAVEDLVRGGIYLSRHRRERSHAVKAQHISRYDFCDPQSQKSPGLGGELPKRQENLHEGNTNVQGDSDYGFQFNEAGSSVPADFGGSTSSVEVPSFEDYYDAIRMRYVMGLQIMVQLQCEELVKEFKVIPLICGIVAPIWLRYVAWTGVFDDDWADEVILESELRHEEEEPAAHKPRDKYSAEPHNLYGERAVTIVHQSLKKRIPLPCTLAVSFLACHVAREAVLPTDMMKWSLEGKLPYFSAFAEIEKRMSQPPSPCPISSMAMFRPSRAVSAQQLESLAASIAASIGLNLPPVNFYGIALRYLQDLRLPVKKILPHALRIFEWTMDAGLWLSTSEARVPTRACVMSMLIVSIRMLYNINGFGEWERSLSLHFDQDEPNEPELETAWLLHHLYTSYDGVADKYEFSKDLPTYLQHCKDVVFAGLKPSFENHEEEKIIEDLWNFYQKEKDRKPAEQYDKQNRTSKGKEKVTDQCFSHQPHERTDIDSSDSEEDSETEERASRETHVNEAIKRLKLDMEENRFYYIPPRVRPRRLDYVHYVRKKGKGVLTYVAHADYYILLRACARAVQIDIRIMHLGVLAFERRLSSIEERIEKCLRVKPPEITCKYCRRDDDGTPERASGSHRKK